MDLDINTLLWAVPVILALLALHIVIGSYLIAYLATFPPRSRLKHTPKEFGATFEDVLFPSRDGTRLSGWFVPASDPQPHGVVILCHGMMANRSDMLSWAESLWRNSFSLLLFDFRANALSEGDRCTAGCYEPWDLQGAVDYVETRPDCVGLPLGVFGFSMGGATAILTAAEDERIQAVGTHGAYATLDGAIQQRCKHHFGPLAPIAERIILRVGDRRQWFVQPPSNIAPIKAVPDLKDRPLLLLHGEKDPIVPANHARSLYNATSGPVELHLLPRSRHKRINRKIRPEAHARVVAFFHKHLW